MAACVLNQGKDHNERERFLWQKAQHPHTPSTHLHTLSPGAWEEATFYGAVKGIWQIDEVTNHLVGRFTSGVRCNQVGP